ncbi:hypothetical protein BLNAU_4771 [Blattamonas nauphoetae]|uniref:Uncharacterized protein n=2 Tax=Blattamonas nauphoetae TaxID=2049346 RepID=A0ABQ9Y952_9EUKA|nr:hypothetical protein BLNAU_4771 [Blattamonas nauphoetae]
MWKELADSGIDAICLPANVSAWCQPNDLYVNANFKMQLTTMDALPSKTQMATNLPKWLDKLESKIQKSLTIDAIRQSFMTTGVYPVDMEQVSVDWPEGSGNASTSRCFDMTSRLLGSAAVFESWTADIERKGGRSTSRDEGADDNREQMRNAFIHPQAVDIQEITDLNTILPDQASELVVSPISSIPQIPQTSSHTDSLLPTSDPLPHNPVSDHGPAEANIAVVTFPPMSQPTIAGELTSSSTLTNEAIADLQLDDSHIVCCGGIKRRLVLDDDSEEDDEGRLKWEKPSKQVCYGFVDQGDEFEYGMEWEMMKTITANRRKKE